MVADGGTSASWLSWMIGAAILVVVVLAAVNVTDGREFVGVAERATTWWLVVALCLQGVTYLAQGEIFRRLPRGGVYRLPLTAAYALSLAKLFIDQTILRQGSAAPSWLPRHSSCEVCRERSWRRAW